MPLPDSALPPEFVRGLTRCLTARQYSTRHGPFLSHLWAMRQSDTRSIPAGVMCSRSRSAALLGRRRATVRFTMFGAPFHRAEKPNDLSRAARATVR
jgi:hypothetical protein